MTAALVVLLGLQLCVEVDATDNAVERVATDASIIAVILVRDISSRPRRLTLRPPQQSTESVEVGAA